MESKPRSSTRQKSLEPSQARAGGTQFKSFGPDSGCCSPPPFLSVTQQPTKANSAGGRQATNLQKRVETATSLSFQPGSVSCTCVTERSMTRSDRNLGMQQTLHRTPHSSFESTALLYRQALRKPRSARTSREPGVSCRTTQAAQYESFGSSELVPRLPPPSPSSLSSLQTQPRIHRGEAAGLKASQLQAPKSQLSPCLCRSKWTMQPCKLHLQFLRSDGLMQWLVSFLFCIACLSADASNREAVGPAKYKLHIRRFSAKETSLNSSLACP